MRIEKLLSLLDSDEVPEVLIEELTQAAGRLNRTADALERALTDQGKHYASHPKRPQVVAAIAGARELADRTKKLALELEGRSLTL